MSRAVCSARSRYRLIQYRLSATRESIGKLISRPLDLFQPSRILVLVSQYPCIFTSAPLGGVHNQGSTTQGHPRETPWHQGHVAAIEDVRPQIDVSSLNRAIQKTRRSRQV